MKFTKKKKKIQNFKKSYLVIKNCFCKGNFIFTVIFIKNVYYLFLRIQ